MIPDYQTCMLPLLKYAKDNNEHKFSDAVDYLSNQFNLSQEERKELLPSKTQDVISNRIGWARTYMKKAGLLEENQISAVFHYIPLHSAPAGIKYGRFDGKDEITTEYSERLVRLPMYYGLSSDDQDKVISSVIDFYKTR